MRRVSNRDIIWTMIVLLVVAGSVMNELRPAEADTCLGPPVSGAYPCERVLTDLNLTSTFTKYAVDTGDLSKQINEAWFICRAGTLWVKFYGAYSDTTGWIRLIAGEGQVWKRCAVDSIRVKSGESGGTADVVLRGGF
ncbi:MAG: hypothetical protein KAW17_09510 [Candidatus Eisenbacteria sp.]|nr:hypothetical protein [Candidatus Eisenbacteria bacterium]